MMTRDIKELLLTIKENIRIVEASQDCDKAILSEIEFDFYELMEQLKLFLISERDSYYGYFLMNMQFRANFYSSSVAGIKLNEFPAVLEANPLLLCNYSLKEIIYILCHEVDHVLFNHPAEMVKANPDNDPKTFHDFNLAADAAVNDRIDKEIKKEHRKFLSAPKGCVTSQTLREMYGLPNLLSCESYAYYFGEIHTKKELMMPAEPGDNDPESDNKDISDQSADSSKTPENGDELQSGSKGQGEGNNQEKKTSSEGGSGGNQGDDKNNGDDSQDARGNENRSADGEVITSKNRGKGKDHDWGVDDDPETAEAATRELVNSANEMMNEETRGLMPAHYLSQVEIINRPAVIPWQKILKKYVGTISANKRKTRTRLNRRQPERFDISGTIDDKLLKIVVAIDTSGSVSDDMISEIFNEIFAILAKRKHEITVIECDAEVQRVYKAKNRSEIKTKVEGRGGTCFSPVIEYINNDRYFRDALLIYFTDGFGEPEIPKPRTYRNMWVVFGDEKYLSLEEPYGVVLKL